VRVRVIGCMCMYVCACVAGQDAHQASTSRGLCVWVFVCLHVCMSECLCMCVCALAWQDRTLTRLAQVFVCLYVCVGGCACA